MPLTIAPFSKDAPTGAAVDDDLITVGLVNNMPDAALAATETQFSALLRAAAGSQTVRLRYAYLPEVVRSSAGREHLASAQYWHIEDLLDAGVDALIVTGMEPGAGSLRDEPYWCRFTQLLEWADAHTASSIWSCLAAHAAALCLDGIERRRLEHKRFGVFEHSTLAGHPLLSAVSAPLCIPHSRWNELPVAALRSAGYTILSWSQETGADLFVKHGRSLCVFFQGHPEYEDATLLKEYRRDIGRFVRGQQPHYPNIPRGYFSPTATTALEHFRERALQHREEALLAEFPMALVAEGLESRWHASAVRIYRNWLAFVAAARRNVEAAVPAGS